MPVPDLNNFNKDNVNYNANSLNEFNEKMNEEQEKVANSALKMQNHNTIIEFPKIQMGYFTAGAEEVNIADINFNNEKKIIITPNSINGNIKFEEKFLFGKYDAEMTKPNDMNFEDETIGSRQFEIRYVQGRVLLNYLYF